jgi:hypothetical protein
MTQVRDYPNISVEAIRKITKSSRRAVASEILSLTNLIPWNQVLLEKLPVAQSLKNFPIFHKTRRFINVFTRVHPPMVPILS